MKSWYELLSRSLQFSYFGLFQDRDQSIVISVFSRLSYEASMLFTSMEGFDISFGKKVRYTAGQRGSSPFRAIVSILSSTISSLNFSEKVLHVRNCLGKQGIFPFPLSFLHPQH